MTMSGEIRVKTDKKYAQIYKDLRNTAMGDAHEIFFLSTAIGYKNKKAIPLGRAGDDRFWSSTITPEEYYTYYAIMLEENGLDFLSVKDDSKVMSRMEEYANGGMSILLQTVLKDFVLIEGEEPRIDMTHKKELPKAVLYYTYDETIKR